MGPGEEVDGGLTAVVPKLSLSQDCCGISCGA